MRLLRVLSIGIIALAALAPLMAGHASTLYLRKGDPLPKQQSAPAPVVPYVAPPAPVDDSSSAPSVLAPAAAPQRIPGIPTPAPCSDKDKNYVTSMNKDMMTMQSGSMTIGGELTAASKSALQRMKAFYADPDNIHYMSDVSVRCAAFIAAEAQKNNADRR